MQPTDGPLRGGPPTNGTASLHAHSHEALLAATDALAALALEAAHLQPHQPHSSAASAQQSAAHSQTASQTASPSLAPTPGGIVHHAPPSLSVAPLLPGASWQHGAHSLAPAPVHQPLMHAAVPSPLRVRAAPRAPAARAGWVDMYDQRSDNEGDDAPPPPRSAAAGSRSGPRHSPDSSEDESPHHLPGAAMSASSSSSSLRSLASGSSASAASARAMRKGISSGVKGLSPRALKEVEALVRKLGRQDGHRHPQRERSVQIEGKRGGGWHEEDEDEAEMSASEDDASSEHAGRSISGASRASSSHDVPPHHAHAVIASPGMGLPSLGMQRNWNAEFQACFTAICNDATILDNVAGYSALSSLAHDFLWTASTLGRIIISEKQLPEHQKTIPSIDVGGYAGGLKYIAHNIIFKFSVDNDDGLYGGDHFAAKAAGHELLGLSHYYRTVASSEGRLGLHVPLAALIDFRGYRLYAICKLPIDGTRTLVLGSMNGGNTILNSNPEMDAKMRAVAEVLNLKVHDVTDGAGVRTTLPSCFDIEGHLGRDGKFYLVDFHRTFPPEPPAIIIAQHVAQLQQQQSEDSATAIPAPVSSSSSSDSPPPPDLATLHTHQSSVVLKNTYLYRLLRPELVRSYRASPLSSNVYSVFDRDATNYAHVLQAFKGLLTTVIPAFARALERNPPPQRFVDSGLQMQQQTNNMIRTSSGGGGQGSAPAVNVALNTPRLSRSPSISSLVSPAYEIPNSGAGGSYGVASPALHPAPPLSLDVLSSVLHQSGINVRFLGLVRGQMRCESWRRVILVEILARLLKNELRARWRAIRLKSMSDGPFRAAAVSFVNLIFFPSLASNTYWAEHLHTQINLHFPGALGPAEQDPKIFNLKGSLQTATKGTKGCACPVHHATHTHVAVDPADPLSFLPPLVPEKVPEPASSPSTTQPQQHASPPQHSHPTMFRSPSLSSMGPMPMSSPSLASRSFSTSVGYVKSAAAAAAAAGILTDSPGTPPRRHHAHSHSVSTPSATAAAAAAAAASKNKPRAPRIPDSAPEIPCPHGGCCAGTRPSNVDYLLLLFMRFIQLSGVVLEDGIMDAIQDAADKQAAADAGPSASATHNAADDLRHEFDQGELVGEGTLQMAAPVATRQISSVGIPAPHPIHHRSVTEPRGHGGPLPPTSPPALLHTMSTSHAAAYPPLPQRHANSPSMSTPSMPRNLSVTSLSASAAHALSVSVSSPWRPGSGLSLSVNNSVPSTPPPQTPPSASGRSTPFTAPGFGMGDPLGARSRSGSLLGDSRLPASGGLSMGGGPGTEVWNLWSWPFVAPLEEMHIRGLVEKVKQVNLLWYAEGTSLLIKSWIKLQQHNRWVVEQRASSAGATSPGDGSGRDAPQGLSGWTQRQVQKRFFLPGHLASDEVFRDGPTPFLKMAFHLAGLAANKFQQALKYCLDDPLTLANLSFLMSAVYNKYAAAMSYLKRAVQANPTHVRSWYYLGQLQHYHLHDSNQARACYEKALTLAPNGEHANTLKDYGNLMQYSFNNPAEAEAKYRRALEVEPRHIKSLQLLATLRTRTCDSLRDYDEVKKLLYDAARSPMGVVETRLNAQQKYLNLVICQAELYAEEHALAHQQAQAAGATAPAAVTGAPNNLIEATKRWREAIDFMQCPHSHYGSSRDVGAGDDASSTIANQALASMTATTNTLPAGLSSMTNLSLPSHSGQAAALATTATQFMVSSAVIKPSAMPSFGGASSGAARPPKKTPSDPSATDVPAFAPAAGFSWCVCPDCCGVNFDSLPLADTLLSYAQFIHQFEVAGVGSSALHVAAKSIESEKYFQFAILVHHTLVTSRKKHKQVQIKHEMHPEAAASAALSNDQAHISGGSSLYRPNTLSTNTLPYHTPHASTSAHEVLAASSPPLNHTAYAFVPPAVKTAYLMTAPSFPGSPATALPPVASAANASVLLEQAAPFLTPAWLHALGVVASFSVVVSKPNPVNPLAPPSATAVGEAERRLQSMSAQADRPQVGISILASIGSVMTPHVLGVSTSGPPALARPPSSWDASNPKKWASLPATIPAGASATGNKASLNRTGSASAAANALTEKELIGAELALEVDLEFDGGIERACECIVDHSFGEAATSCSCSFPSPRYLVCYALFLMRVGRPAQAAYAFQSALVLHPFGRTGSSCLARMADCSVRAGVLGAPGTPQYATNVVQIYQLFRKAVGIDPWEGQLPSTVGVATAHDSSDSIANRHTFIASLTATTLFVNFIKEHGFAMGPIAAPTPAPTTPGVSAPSTPRSTCSTSSSASTGPLVTLAPVPPSIGPLIRDASSTLTRVQRMLDGIKSDMAAQSAAYKASLSRGASSAAPSYALALGNTHCKCKRPLRGKPCLCSNQLLKAMIAKVHVMRSRVENRRKATNGEIRHHDAASAHHGRKAAAAGARGGATATSGLATNALSASTPANTSADWERGGDKSSSRGGRGGGRTAGGDRHLKASAREEEKPRDTTATTDETNTMGGPFLPPAREGSGKWSQVVVKSAETVAAALPKRSPSVLKESSRESVGKPSVQVGSNSGGSTPVIATPISSSPMLQAQSAALQLASMQSLATFTLLPATLPTPGLLSSSAGPPVVPGPTPAVVAVPLLPTSQWMVKPTLAVAAPTTAAAAPQAASTSSTAQSQPSQPSAATVASVATPMSASALAPPAVFAGSSYSTLNSACFAPQPQQQALPQQQLPAVLPLPVVIGGAGSATLPSFPPALLSLPSTPGAPSVSSSARVAPTATATPFTFFSPPPPSNTSGAASATSSPGTSAAAHVLPRAALGAAGAFAFKQSTLGKKR